MYFELEKVSRGYQVTTNSIRQTFVYIVCDEDLDQDDSPDSGYGEFFTPNDDVGLAKFVYATFPIYRVFPITVSEDIILLLTEHSADQVGDKWKVTLTYSVDASESNPSYVQFGVDIGGDTAHIQKALETRSEVSRIEFSPPFTDPAILPPETYNLIGLTKDTIEGVDVIARGLKFNITAYYSSAVWSPSVLLTWAVLQSGYNDATFYGFAAGEVQLLSISAQGEVYKKVPVTFNFKAAPNINGVADLPFTPLFGLGHDFVDYLYGAEISENFPVRAPLYRYVRRVYDPVNFDLLGL